MPPKTNANWTVTDEKALIDALTRLSAAAGDSANFKMSTFRLASEDVNKKRTVGGVKTAKSCQQKWGQLRASFAAIQAIKNKSGWTWSDDTGASITVDMAPAWEDFIRIHPKAKPFRNRGWTHLAAMTALMPTAVRGNHVFRPAQGTSGLNALPPAPVAEDDESDDDLDNHPERASSEPAPVAEPPSEDSNVTQDDAPSTPVANRSRVKRERAVSETPVQRPSKRSRMTGADAIHGLTASIGRFGDSICKVLAGNPTEKTPQRHTRAVKLAQQETWLTPAERLAFMTILEKDIKAADAYLALNSDNVEFRRFWIKNKVNSSA